MRLKTVLARRHRRRLLPQEADSSAQLLPEESGLRPRAGGALCTAGRKGGGVERPPGGPAGLGGGRRA